MNRASTVAALVLLLQSLGWATTHHVYPLGRTIQEAINIAQAGDTVLVHRGYYRQTVTLNPQITVCSTHGSAQTTIDGADLDSSTVHYSQWGPPCILGGPNAGFTLRGGTVYRLWCRGTLYYHCGGLYAYDLVIESGQANSAVKLDNCEDIEFTDVRMIGEAWMGWQIEDSEGIRLNSVEIKQGTTYAIYVESTTFYADDLTVTWASGAGLRTLWSADHILHSQFTNCGYGVSAYGLGFLGPDTLYDVTFDSCGTGISAYPQQQDLELNVSNCYFTACTTGVSLTRAQGSVTACHFENIYDTGLGITDYGGQLTVGGPDAAQKNEFWYVDGIGIHLDSGARATVRNNEFYNVLGTGIQCETGIGGTEIRDCVFDGSGGCFEGIVTRESGTVVEIRECTLRDYNLGGFPAPRAVYVNDHTAWLGYWDDLDVDDPGNNSFANTGFNLYYTGPPGTPPQYLRAQLNWWGSDPPDPWGFAGSWRDYIIYAPWLGGPPRGAPPAPGDGPAVPGQVVLSGVSPNPATGTVQFSYELPTKGSAELAVWDLAGRRVRTMIRGELPAVTGTADWDGTDEAGTPTASGPYVCRLRSTAGEATRRFVFMR